MSGTGVKVAQPEPDGLATIMNAELEAMRVCAVALKPLSRESRERAIRWLEKALVYLKRAETL